MYIHCQDCDTSRYRHGQYPLFGWRRLVSFSGTVERSQTDKDIIRIIADIPRVSSHDHQMRLQDQPQASKFTVDQVIGMLHCRWSS